MKSIFTFLLLLLVSTISGQDKIVITGRVSDKESGMLIPYASIVSYGAKPTGTTSDLLGNFRIQLSDTTKDYKIHITAIGYEEVIIPGDRYNLLSDIRLEPAVYQLEEVTVKPLRPKNSTIGSLSHEIRRYNRNSKGTLASQSPQWHKGVYVIPNRDNKNALLTSINYCIEEEGHLGSSFLLRILIPKDKKKLENNRVYSLSDFFDYQTSNIIIKASQKGWNTANLADEFIRIPEDPFFLLFTLVDADGQNAQKGEIGDEMYVPSIALYEKENVNQLYYVLIVDGKIAYIEHKTKYGGQYVPAIVLNCSRK